MDILTSFAIIVLCAAIHASFHLSISILTLLSGHTINREKSHIKLVKLSSALTFGSIFATILLFCSACFIFEISYNYRLFHAIWAILLGLCIGTAFSVWAFYYKRPLKKSNNSEMWVPRSFAKFLNERAKKTRHSAEAFSLGVSGVISEIIFIASPLSVSAIITSQLPESFQFVSIVTYTTISNLPLFIVLCLISGGHSIAKIQIWREDNKRFLQFAAGLGLLILAFAIYSNIFGVQK